MEVCLGVLLEQDVANTISTLHSDYLQLKCCAYHAFWGLEASSAELPLCVIYVRD
jgi:hypothetical protein